MTGKLILNAEEMQRALARIAHEVLERNSGGADVALVGIHSRGVQIARRLADAIQSVERREIDVGSVEPRLHRDDLDVRAPLPIRPSDIPFDVVDRPVVLVDDVLFTGRTIRAAMDALIDYGRPGSIQLAVLVDRGHRELPIRADYVGKNVPTSRQETVQVRLVETDGRDEVVLVSAETAEGDRVSVRSRPLAGTS